MSGKVVKSRRHTRPEFPWCPVDLENTVTFHANASGATGLLSNLRAAKVLWDGREFASAEHAYQASKLVPEQRDQLAVGGRLGGWAGWSLVSSKPTSQWHKKNNVGIIAKLAVGNVKRAHGLGLRLLPDRSHDEAHLEALWREILDSKFRETPALRQQLLDTAPRVLLEQALRGAPNAWNAQLKDGQMRGGNRMGRYLQACRERLQ